MIMLALIGASALAYTPEELLRPGIIHGVAISPTGRFIAFGIGNAVGITDSIAILDMQREASDRVVHRIPLATPTAERIVTQLTWASDSYLLAEMNYAYKQPVPARAPQAALHSIHIGSDGSIKPYDALPRPIRLLWDARPDSKYVYLASGSYAAGFMAPRPYEVELASGSARLLAEPDPVTMAWRVRGGRAVVKFNEGKQGEIANIYARLADDDDWSYVNSLRFPEDRRNHLEVVGEGESPLEDYLRRTRAGSDVDGIHRRDLRSMSITATEFELPGRDALSAQFRQGKFVSAIYLDDTMQMRFSNEEFQRHYEGIRKYFGADTNIRATMSSTLSGAWVLHVSGPRNPGEYHVYDPERHHIDQIGAERPWLSANRLAPSVPIVVAARDGTQLHAYLTCPVGNPRKNRPLVVLPPAGPWTYAYLRYNAYPQAFAAEGWCTVEPNIRGTYGRGRAFQALGFGQWNGRAAEDLVDTVRALVREGIADPGRVAGLGELLAATTLLSAEVTNVGMFRALVAYAPVLNGESVLSDKKNRFGRNSLPHEDWSQWLGPLANGSALQKQLIQIQTSLFLIHPTLGSDAPVDDTRAFEKALAKSRRSPRTRYPEFRGAALPAGDEALEQLRAVLDFLRSHLGSGSESGAEDSDGPPA